MWSHCFQLCRSFPAFSAFTSSGCLCPALGCAAWQWHPHLGCQGSQSREDGQIQGNEVFLNPSLPELQSCFLLSFSHAFSDPQCNSPPEKKLVGSWCGSAVWRELVKLPPHVFVLLTSSISSVILEAFDFTFIFFSHKFFTLSPHLFVFSLHLLPAQTVFSQENLGL